MILCFGGFSRFGVMFDEFIALFYGPLIILRIKKTFDKGKLFFGSLLNGIFGIDPLIGFGRPNPKG
jgi:hypothetical protein